MKGYLAGDISAASYLGVDRKTLRRWQRDPGMIGRELLQPRIVRGRKFYRITNFDRFMDPALNTTGAYSPTHNLPNHE